MASDCVAVDDGFDEAAVFRVGIGDTPSVHIAETQEAFRYSDGVFGAKIGLGGEEVGAGGFEG